MTDYHPAPFNDFSTKLRDPWTVVDHYLWVAALNRAHAALAEDPVGPSDEELDEFAVFWWGPDTDERTAAEAIECGSMAAFARAVLARWGTPANTINQEANGNEP
jgi:hypothetical protein